MDLDSLRQHRIEHDRFLAEHYASPLPEEYQAGFSGLDYFVPDPAWCLTGRFEPVAPRPVPIPSTAGTDSEYTMIGEVILPVGGTQYRLVVLDDGDGGRFIPFRDGTAGDTTYGGGRYVNLEIHPGGSATVDFNRAANPYCVYDEEFTCPLPPRPNCISEPIPAGERMWYPPA